MSRYRERYNEEPATTWSIYDRVAGWPIGPACAPISDVITESEGTFSAVQTTESMTDVVTPKFHRLQSAGVIINSPMTKVTEVFRNHPCIFNYEFEKDQWSTSCDPDQWTTYNRTLVRANHYSTFYFTNGRVDLPVVPDYDTADLVNQAVSKAWSNVDVSDIQGLVCVAESHKTMYSFISIMKRLIKILIKIKRLDGKGLAREFSAKELSDRYMELRYAIRPLMYDARGITKALANEAQRDHDRITFRGTKSYSDADTSSSTSVVAMNDNAGTWSYEKTIMKKWSRNVQVRAGILTQLEELSALNIWGLTQPIESAWELVPFSFIVDWFFNVGDVLASWTPNWGLNTLASWYTIENVVYQYMERTHANDSLPAGTGTAKGITYSNGLSGCWVDCTTTTKQRVPDPTRAMMPTVSLRLDGFKLADLLIIAKQIFAR